MSRNRKSPMTVEQVDALIDSDPSRYWWETHAKTLIAFRPTRGAALFRADAVRNTRWRGEPKWGTARRIEVGADGLFRL